MHEQLYIFKIERTNDKQERWDAAFAFVIICKSEQRCRELASENAGDEGKELWFDESVKVNKIGIPYEAYDEEQLILTDFNYA